MDRKPDVSVIIAMYNSEPWIQTAIQSILQQEPHGLQLEIIVIDDGSTDKSAEIVNQIRNENIRLVQLPKNMGQAHARNKGMEMANGEWIQFMDSDDRISHDLYQKFEKAIQPNVNSYMFSFIRELPQHSLQQRIRSIKDKRAFGHYGGTVCNKFIRKEISIPFQPLRYSDICFCIDMMIEQDLQLGLIQDAYYFYNKRQDHSVTANFDKVEFTRMTDYILGQIPKSDSETRKFILETCIAFLFDRKIPLMSSLPVAVKSLLKLHRHLPYTLLHQNRKSIENKII